jgi:hypothetical protein
MTTRRATAALGLALFTGSIIGSMPETADAAAASKAAAQATVLVEAEGLDEHKG